MRLDAVHPGDKVAVDIRGRRFEAIVTGSAADGRIPIAPCTRNCGYFSAKASQVRKVLRSGSQLALGEAA